MFLTKRQKRFLEFLQDELNTSKSGAKMFHNEVIQRVVILMELQNISLILIPSAICFIIYLI